MILLKLIWITLIRSGLAKIQHGSKAAGKVGLEMHYCYSHCMLEAPLRKV